MEAFLPALGNALKYVILSVFSNFQQVFMFKGF